MRERTGYKADDRWGLRGTKSVEVPQLVKGIGVAVARATMPIKTRADLIIL
jgi:hypothetical protein